MSLDSRKYLSLQRKIKRLEYDDTINVIITFDGVFQDDEIVIVKNGKTYENPSEELKDELIGNVEKTIYLSGEDVSSEHSEAVSD